MGRALRIGLYSPYFGSAYGGGEKYLGVTAEALHRRYPEHSVEIVSPRPVDRDRYERVLNLDLSGIQLVAGNQRVTPVHRLAARARLLRPLRNRVVADRARTWSRSYDLWLAMAYVVPVSSLARRSVVLCQFPYRLETARARDDLASFEAVVCQSEYVRHWTRRFWDRDAAVCNPPIDIPLPEPDFGAKGPVILSVGRFVAGGHNKRHDLLVRAFRALCDEGLSGWELQLAGSVHHDAASVEYLRGVRELARGYPVTIHADIPFDDLQALYAAASIYWHAAGEGVDEDAHPEALEHFGMATAEAMGHGTAPVVIARGGQVEVVRDRVDGLLWTTLDELRARTRELVADAALRERLGRQARASSGRWSRAAFRERMAGILAPHIEALEAAPT